MVSGLFDGKKAKEHGIDGVGKEAILTAFDIRDQSLWIIRSNLVVVCAPQTSRERKDVFVHVLKNATNSY